LSECFRSTGEELPVSVVHDSSLSVNYIEIGKFTKCDVNQMWILKTSKDLLEYIQSRSLSSCNSIKTFDFFTLYTSISHSKLKDRLKELVQMCFIQKNGQRRYKYLRLLKNMSTKYGVNQKHEHVDDISFRELCQSVFFK
jgi:hypothetical protein